MKDVVVTIVLDVVVVLVGGVDVSDVDSVSVRVVLVGSVVELAVVVPLDVGGSVDWFDCRAESGRADWRGLFIRGTCDASRAGGLACDEEDGSTATVTMTAAHSRFIALS